jgi:hypothetical protein
MYGKRAGGVPPARPRKAVHSVVRRRLYRPFGSGLFRGVGKIRQPCVPEIRHFAVLARFLARKRLAPRLRMLLTSPDMTKRLSLIVRMAAAIVATHRAILGLFPHAGASRHAA